MKNVRYLLFLLVAGYLVISSCTKTPTGSSSSSTSTTGSTTSTTSGSTTATMGGDPNAPTLKLTFDRTSANTGEHISITAQATAKKKTKVFHMILNARANGITTQLQDLNNLNDSNKITSYDYITGTPGTKTIVLICTDNAGHQDSASQVITITGSPINLNAPTFKISFDKSNANTGEHISITSIATAKNKAKMFHVTLSERFKGVTTILQDLTGLNDSNKIFSYDYITGTPGTRTFILSGQDDGGNIDSAKQDYTIGGSVLAPVVTLTSDKSTYNAGTSVKLSFSATSKLAKITKFEIDYRTGSNPDSFLTGGTFNNPSTTVSTLTQGITLGSKFEGNMTFTVIMTDENGVTGKASVTVSIINALKTYTITLGGPDNTTYKQGLNFANGTALDASNATQSNCDMVVYFGGTYYYFYSPSNSAAQGQYSWINWSSPRTTNFVNGYTSSGYYTFADVRSIDELKFNYNNAYTIDNYDHWTINDGHWGTFKTADGKIGMYQVEEIKDGPTGYPSGDSYIKINIKMQK